ncbi:MAG TPA: hypothetical protein VK545_12910, partial [Streptomyces sp.]|nr:hypothetical protein [Streptomyces sp.]
MRRAGHAGPDGLAAGADAVGTRDTGAAARKHHSTGATATVTRPGGHAHKAGGGPERGHPERRGHP